MFCLLVQAVTTTLDERMFAQTAGNTDRVTQNTRHRLTQCIQI